MWDAASQRRLLSARSWITFDVDRMPEPTTKRARPNVLLGGAWVACSLVGHFLLYGGAVALVLISVFAFAEWSGYGRLVLATWGTASAGCIAVGLLLRACAKHLGRALAPERAPAD